MKKWYRLIAMVCLFSQFMYLGAPAGEIFHSDSVEVEEGGDALHESPLHALVERPEPSVQHPAASDSLSSDLSRGATPDQAGANSDGSEGNLEQATIQDPVSNSQLVGAARALSGIGAVAEGHSLPATASDVVLSPKLQEARVRLDQTIKAFHELMEGFEKTPPSTSGARRLLLSTITKLSAELNRIEKQLDLVSGDPEGKQELRTVIKEMYGKTRKLADDVKKSGAKEEGGKVEPAPLALASLPTDIGMYPEQSGIVLMPGDERGEQIEGLFKGQIGPEGLPKGLAIARGALLKAIGRLRNLATSGEAKIKANKDAAKKDLEEGTKTELQVLRPDEALAVELFHIIDEEVALTALASNAPVALSPEIIGDMVLMIKSGQLATFVKPKANDKAFLEKWHNYYKAVDIPLPVEDKGIKPLAEFSKFKKSARFFLRALHECVVEDEQTALDVLLANLHQKVQDAPSIAEQTKMEEEYCQVLKPSGVKLEPYFMGDRRTVIEWYSKERFTLETIESEIENITFLVLALSSDPDVERIYQTSINYAVTYEEDRFPACQEGVITTLLRLIFYDPVTQELNLSMIPQAIQDSMSPELKKYITGYKKLGKANRAKAARALVPLIENVPGVKYCRTSPTGARYELDGSTQNTVDLLKTLFGIRDDQVTGKRAEELKSIFDLLSTADHVLTLEFLENDQTPHGDGHPTDRDSFALTLQTPEFAALTEISLDSEHGESSFPGITTVGYSNEFIRNLWLAGKVTNQFLLGVCDLPADILLEKLISESLLQTKDDFLYFFKNYTNAFEEPLTQPLTLEKVYYLFLAYLPIDIPSKSVEPLIHMFEALKELGIDSNQEFILDPSKFEEVDQSKIRKTIHITLLQIALHAKQPRMVKILFANGAHPSEKEVELILTQIDGWDDDIQTMVLQHLYDQGKIIISSMSLLKALREKCGALVAFLLEHGVSPARFQIREMETLVSGWSAPTAMSILNFALGKGFSIHNVDAFLPQSRSQMLSIIETHNYTNLLPVVAEKTNSYLDTITFRQNGKEKTVTLLEALAEHGDMPFVRKELGSILTNMKVYDLATRKEGIRILEKIGIPHSELLTQIFNEKAFGMLWAFPDPREALAELRKIPGFSLDTTYGRNKQTLLDYALDDSSFSYTEVLIEAGIHVNPDQAPSLLSRLAMNEKTLSLETQAHLLKLLSAKIAHETINEYIDTLYPSLRLAWEMAQHGDESAPAPLSEADQGKMSAARDRVDGLME